MKFLTLLFLYYPSGHYAAGEISYLAYSSYEECGKAISIVKGTFSQPIERITCRQTLIATESPRPKSRPKMENK